MEEKYFAAVNSCHGFVSYYGDAFGSCERIYIIKGGPGTGKSYFMRALSRRAENDGHSVVYIYCSSDPDSLDGIIIDGRIAFFDGTAPHTAEASCPGARDELIDLGRFWNADELAKKRETIESLAKKKSSSYARAYDCLAAAGNAERAISRLLEPCILEEKLHSAARRYLKPLPNGQGYKKTDIAVNSISMRGCVRFSTLEEKAASVISVNDPYGTAHLFLEALRKEAERRGMKIRLSHDPAFPEHADALELCETGLLFTVGEHESGRKVNMHRFIDEKAFREIRDEYKWLAACKSSALRAAKSTLTGTAAHHFAIENIYISCMDFDAKDTFTNQFANHLMLALKKKV